MKKFSSARTTMEEKIFFLDFAFLRRVPWKSLAMFWQIQSDQPTDLFTRLTELLEASASVFLTASDDRESHEVSDSIKPTRALFHGDSMSKRPDPLKKAVAEYIAGGLRALGWVMAGQSRSLMASNSLSFLSLRKDLP